MSARKSCRRLKRTQQEGNKLPLPVESLTPKSSVGAVREAINQSYEACMREPIPEGTNVSESEKKKWCGGKIYSMAEKAIGRSLGREA